MNPMLVAHMAALLTQAANGAEATFLDNVKTVVDIIGTGLTAVAVIIGGIWAYFKFVKGRTFRPRLEMDLAGQWRLVNGTDLLHARVTLKNIGASKFTLLQRGTGLRVSVLASDQPAAPASTTWESLKVFVLLAEHQWIEPVETVSDDLLLDLGVSDPVLTLFETRVVLKRARLFGGNIVVLERRVIPIDSTIAGSEEAAAASGNGKEGRSSS